MDCNFAKRISRPKRNSCSYKYTLDLSLKHQLAGAFNSHPVGSKSIFTVMYLTQSQIGVTSKEAETTKTVYLFPARKACNEIK